MHKAKIQKRKLNNLNYKYQFTKLIKRWETKTMI